MDHTINRHIVCSIIMLVTVPVHFDNMNGVNHGTVQVITGLEIQLIQYGKQHPAIMSTIRCPDRLMNFKFRIASQRIKLFHKTLQRSLCNNGINHLFDDAIGLIRCCFSHPEEQFCFSSDFFKGRKLFFIHFLLSPRSEIVDQLHQHFSQGIRQLLPTSPAVHDNHGVTNTGRMAPDFPDGFGSAALTIYFDKFGWYAPDQISIQPQFIKSCEL